MLGPFLRSTTLRFAEVIEAWAPMPITPQDVEAVQSNLEGEYRLVAEIDDRWVVGISSIVAQKNELRACYVVPSASRRGVGSALLREIERAARERGSTYLEAESSLTAAPFYISNGYQVLERGEHVLHNGQRMTWRQNAKDLTVAKFLISVLPRFLDGHSACEPV
jgi:putative acetyltransferase